jgi:hypothetical protein
MTQIGSVTQLATSLLLNAFAIRIVGLLASAVSRQLETRWRIVDLSADISQRSVLTAGEGPTCLEHVGLVLVLRVRFWTATNPSILEGIAAKWTLTDVRPKS